MKEKIIDHQNCKFLIKSKQEHLNLRNEQNNYEITLSIQRELDPYEYETKFNFETLNSENNSWSTLNLNSLQDLESYIFDNIQFDENSFKYEDEELSIQYDFPNKAVDNNEIRLKNNRKTYLKLKVKPLDSFESLKNLSNSVRDIKNNLSKVADKVEDKCNENEANVNNSVVDKSLDNITNISVGKSSVKSSNYTKIMLLLIPVLIIVVAYLIQMINSINLKLELQGNEINNLRSEYIKIVTEISLLTSKAKDNFNYKSVRNNKENSKTKDNNQDNKNKEPNSTKDEPNPTNNEKINSNNSNNQHIQDSLKITSITTIFIENPTNDYNEYFLITNNNKTIQKIQGNNKQFIRSVCKDKINYSGIQEFSLKIDEIDIKSSLRFGFIYSDKNDINTTTKGKNIKTNNNPIWLLSISNGVLFNGRMDSGIRISGDSWIIPKKGDLVTICLNTELNVIYFKLNNEVVSSSIKIKNLTGDIKNHLYPSIEIKYRETKISLVN